MHAIIAEHTARRTPNPLPPVDCAPWCEDGDGHTDRVLHPRDQYCASVDYSVPMTREPLVEGTEEGTRELDTLRAYLIRERFEAEAHIELGRGDMAGVELTPAEALELARVLTLLAGAARA